MSPRFEDKSRLVPRGHLADALPLRSQESARTALDYRKIEQRNTRLSRDERDAQQASGYCTYPNCKCIVETSTTQPAPDCARGLTDLPATGDA